MPEPKRKVPEPSPVQPDLDEWQTKYTLLTSTLQLAVPLWIDQLRNAGWDHISVRAKACSQIVAEKGDIILFRSKKKGESAEVFNRLAEGLACLAFVPGGIKIFGEHWEATQADDVPGRSKPVLLGLLESIKKGLTKYA